MRKTALRPGKAPQRKTPIRERNPKRAAKKEQECFGPHAKYVRTLPCLLCGGPSEAAHVRSVGAGGKAEANLVNLCADHHRLGKDNLHDGIETFQREWDIDLKAKAAELWRDSPANPKNVPEGGKSGRRRPRQGRDDELTGHPGTHSPARER